MSSILVTEQQSKSILMTLNRPKNLNAVNAEMISMIYSNLKAFETNADTIDMVILKGAGKNFSSGGDVKSLYTKTRILFRMLMPNSFSGWYADTSETP